jgi:hypothetical protein
MTERSSFRVSAALKSLIGRDLITNPYVALFELVKNSFDADASRVDIHIADEFIAVIDNGRGMTETDITDKWLFVAYSEKKGGIDRPRPGSERYSAGSKGVGRFAADQLGAVLELQTRVPGATRVDIVRVAWDEFEQDQAHHFMDIAVSRSTADAYELPKGCKPPKHGTALLITRLRQPWSRDGLIRLRRYLSRLLDPFEEQGSGFSIHLHAPSEVEADAANRRVTIAEGNEDASVDVVNGRIETNLQSVLASGTTSISVKLDAERAQLITELTDRGDLVYKMAEPNRWPGLANSAFDCRLYYLNTAAKHRFARRMGVRAVDFGSVFLFRNGFRVFPIGEVGDDFFRIARRQQQGTRRFLGTRDIVGRVNVIGSGEDFVESTSRDQGLIQTPAVEALRSCFVDTCLKRLEAYVVGVAWKDKADQSELTPERLRRPEARERLVGVLAGLTRADGAILIDVAPNLDDLLASQLEKGEKTLAALENIAEHRRDPKLKAAAQAARTRLKELDRQRDRAERERDTAYAAAEQAEIQRRKAEDIAAQSKDQLDTERARALFLEASAPIDASLLQALMHQVGIQSADAGAATRNALRFLHRHPLDVEKIEGILTRIAWRVEQMQVVTRFATRANFRLDAQETRIDVAVFMRQYLGRVSSVYHDTAIRLSGAKASFVRPVRPIDLSIVLDNLVANARSAGATAITFAFSYDARLEAPQLTVRVADDGRGLSPSITDVARVFERGFSTTEGSGLGLWHVRNALTDIGADISAEVDDERRLTFVIRVRP